MAAKGKNMKRLFMAAVAAAALSSLFVHKAAAETEFNWTGIYVGAFAGYGWGHSNWDSVYPSVYNFDDSINPRGGFFGGLIGYNWQVAPNWVLGLEADGAIANMVESKGGPGDYYALYRATIESKINSLGTVRARVAYTWGREMFYVTGGWAWSHNGNTMIYPPTNKVDNPSATHLGWTAGAGLEHALSRNWVVKAEYLFMNFGSKDYLYPTAFCANPASNCVFHTDLNIQTLRLGLNYRF